MSIQNKEVTRFSSYTSPVIQVVKYVDTEEQSGSVMYDLYINSKREQRYDIQGLLYRLELMFRSAGSRYLTEEEIKALTEGSKNGT